jgi:hypothetical protein
MNNVYGLHASRNVGRASRAWWLRRIRSAIGLAAFAVVMVFAFLVAMTSER